MQRRVEWLERRLTGTSDVQISPPDLTSLYVQACRPVEPSSQLVELWRLPLRTIGVEELLTMGRWMRDPFPWKPFLIMLSRFQGSGFDVRRETQRMWDLSQDCLDIQGLSLLRPGDVMGYPVRIREAIDAISL